MNKRIKLLAEQAHSESYEQYLLRQSKEGAANVIFYDMFNQKFAELIVRECASVIHQRIGPKSALDVLEHFGVEE